MSYSAILRNFCDGEDTISNFQDFQDFLSLSQFCALVFRVVILSPFVAKFTFDFQVRFFSMYLTPCEHKIAILSDSLNPSKNYSTKNDMIREGEMKFMGGRWRNEFW